MGIMKALTFFGWPLLFLPTAVVYFGVSLNAICTIANGGVMPVRSVNCDQIFSADADPDLIHVCLGPKSRMKPLADIITQGDGIVSVGDELQDIGEEMKKLCYVLWGVIAVFFLIRKKKFYV